MESIEIRLQRITTIFTVFLLVLQARHLNCNALLLKCPLYQMHFQKIVGFRPPVEYMDERNLIYSPPPPINNFKDRNRFIRDGYNMPMQQQHSYIDDQRAALLTSSSSSSTPTSAICWRICNEDDDCIAYVHLIDTNECYGYSYFERTQHYKAINGELSLIADAEAIFYEKTCLKVPNTCKSHMWTLTKIPGTSLIFQGKKTIPNLVTRRECAERCLFETEFKCLSASFTPSYRNNRERFIEYGATPLSKQHIVTLGRCILSDKDKMIQPDAFRAAPYDEEYIENQCYERPVESDHCSYELYANSSFIYAEAKYRGLSQKECQARCTHESRFYCQGVSFYFVDDLNKSECLLHSEDLISMGPRSLKLREHSVYMRRVKCLDVQVLCTNNEMSIKYTPRDWFNGKMYVSMHAKDCTIRGNGTNSTLLRLAIGSEAKESRCGILRAYEVSKVYQRIFISALIVIQNNPNVQTQGDRLIKVGCIMSNTTMKNAYDDLPNDDQGSGDDQEERVPSAIALESSLQFTQEAPPHEGSLLINTTDHQLLPKVTLQIIDLSHEHETNDVQIGENLELQIIAEYSATEQQLDGTIDLPPLPDFRATSLIAKTQDNQNHVLLIDHHGCPTDVTVFPALERVRTISKNFLRGRFHAFKFSGSSMVNFDVKINFCLHNRCPEENCQSGNDQMEKWQANRQRRQSPQQQPQEQQHVQVQNPIYISTVVDVLDDHLDQSQNYSENAYFKNQTDLELPLNYNLRVRGPDIANTNSFLYGERGILLIAGIDNQLHVDNVCLNQSLLIALLIFWLMFQIVLLFSCCYVIQRYKRLATLEDERRKIQESLEYFDERRVHWADQGGYTL